MGEVGEALSNICTKNYWNWTTTVKIIIGGWVVYFFGGHTRLVKIANLPIPCKFHTPVKGDPLKFH